MLFSTEVALNPPCIAFLDKSCYQAYVLFQKSAQKILNIAAFFSAPGMGWGIVTTNQHFQVYGFEKLKDDLPDWTEDTYPPNFCCLFNAPIPTRNQPNTHSNLFKVWSIKFRETETHSPIKPDSERIEKTVTFAEKLKSEKHAQESSKQREMVLLPALLLVGFDENSMSLVVKSVHSVCTAMQEHKAQFEQLVGCLIHCSLQSHLVVCSSDPYLSTLNDVNFEILIPDKVLAMILSVLSTSDLLNTIV